MSDVTLRWLVAAVHLLALGIGLGAIVARAAALGAHLDMTGLRKVFRADNLWALAGLLWISTRVPRAFFGLEKGTAYYLESPAFRLKMAFLLALLLLEIVPVTTLVRWRIGLRRSDILDTSRAMLLARISVVQALLVILMVLAATAMARGVFS